VGDAVDVGADRMPARRRVDGHGDRRVLRAGDARDGEEREVNEQEGEPHGRPNRATRMPRVVARICRERVRAFERRWHTCATDVRKRLSAREPR
jgi:hypothetical protein